MAPQGPPKWSKMQYSHHNIAIFTSCPKSPKWCHMVPKGLQNESLGTPKCSKVEPSGPPRVPRGAQSAPKCAKRSPWETPWNASWAQSGPSALQGSIFKWILSDFEVHFSGIWVGCFVFFIWFWHGFCCKGSTKDEQSLHVKVQKSRTTFHNVCLFACCQLGLSIILESIAELSGPC